MRSSDTIPYTDLEKNSSKKIQFWFDSVKEAQDFKYLISDLKLVSKKQKEDMEYILAESLQFSKHKTKRWIQGGATLQTSTKESARWTQQWHHANGLETRRISVTSKDMFGHGISIILLNIGMYFVAPAVLIMKIRKRI